MKIIKINIFLFALSLVFVRGQCEEIKRRNDYSKMKAYTEQVVSKSVNNVNPITLSYTEGVIDNEPIILARVVVGKVEWVGLCCGEHGYGDVNIQYYLCDFIQGKMKIYSFETSVRYFSKMGFEKDGVLKGRHLQFFVVDQERNYFMYQPNKGVFKVLQCSEMEGWGHSVPPTPCFDNEYSEVFPEADNHLKVIDKRGLCIGEQSERKVVIDSTSEYKWNSMGNKYELLNRTQTDNLVKYPKGKKAHQHKKPIPIQPAH